jgi:hypothetical protein
MSDCTGCGCYMGITNDPPTDCDECCRKDRERLRGLLRWIRANTDVTALDEIDDRIDAELGASGQPPDVHSADAFTGSEQDEKLNRP